MVGLPGWDSLNAVSKIHSTAELVGIGFLVLLALAEGITWVYGVRKDDLTEAQQSAARQRHDEEIARIQLDTAQANERASQLEKENLDLRQKIAGRRITSEQHDLLVTELSKVPADVVLQTMSDGESAIFASDLLKVFTDAHWRVTTEFPLGEVWHGLTIMPTEDPSAARLAAALSTAQIPFQIGDQAHVTQHTTLMVGAKPPPF
jgi:multidrug efflux pump subunit AcrA (membrane-fusion protein)